MFLTAPTGSMPNDGLQGPATFMDLKNASQAVKSGLPWFARAFTLHEKDFMVMADVSGKAGVSRGRPAFHGEGWRFTGKAGVSQGRPAFGASNPKRSCGVRVCLRISTIFRAGQPGMGLATEGRALRAAAQIYRWQCQPMPPLFLYCCCWGQLCLKPGLPASSHCSPVAQL